MKYSAVDQGVDFTTRILVQFIQNLVNYSFATFVLAYAAFVLSLFQSRYQCFFICTFLLVIFAGAVSGLIIVARLLFHIVHPKLRVKSRNIRMRNMVSQSINSTSSIAAVEIEQIYTDDLPIIRRFIFSAFVLFIFLLCIALTDILLTVHFYIQVIGLWISTLPFLLSSSILLLCVLSLKSFSPRTCLNLVLLYIEMVI